MSDVEVRGRAFADRAAVAGDLAPSEVYEFGSWLLDVMSRVIVVQDSSAVAMELRSLARQAYYQHVLSAGEQHRLGRWVTDDLGQLRQWDRRASDRNPANRGPGDRRVGGSRATDVDAEVVKASQLAALDRYFGISQSLIERGCQHGVKPAKACPSPECEARRAHVAWETLEPASLAS
jgi:hypothetical protein